MIGHGVVSLAHQASLPEIDQALRLLGGLVVGFVAAFAAYVLVLGPSGWPGATARTLVGIVGGVLLLVLGLGTVLIAVALLATPLYLLVVSAVLGCLGLAGWLLWRHLRHPASASDPGRADDTT